MALIVIYFDGVNIAHATEVEKTYFHFPNKFKGLYPIELYVEYKPTQLVNSKGLSLSLNYVNKGNVDISLVSDENYCTIRVFYNHVSVEPRTSPSGHFKLATQPIYPRDGEILKQGKSKKVSIIIDKIIDKSKKMANDKNEALVKIIPSLYGIQMRCIGIIFPSNQSEDENSKNRSIYFVSESDVFYIDYKSSLQDRRKH